MEARGGIEPPMKVLQTFALPLGDRAVRENELDGEDRREKSLHRPVACSELQMRISAAFLDVRVRHAL